MSDQLSMEDTVGMITLLGEVAEQSTLIAQKRYLMDGLSRLIGAHSWAWASAYALEPGEAPRSSGFLYGGFTPAQYAKFHEALEHPDTAKLNEVFTREFAEKQTHLTRLREQIDPQDLFVRSDIFYVWREAGVEQVIMSVRPGQNRSQSILGIYRRPGSERFKEREARIAHIVLAEVAWLHDATLPDHLGKQVSWLSPRQIVVLNLLLEGQDRRQIATHLGLSIHTIDGYTKDIYRFFEVHSQPDLIVRFRQGDGGHLLKN